MPRGFFFEFRQSFGRELQYRYTCECCGITTEWFKAMIVQTALKVKRIKRASKGEQIMQNVKMVLVIKEKAKRTLSKAVGKIKKSLLPGTEYTLLLGNPFLVNLFNESFSAGDMCPECGARQSWYPAVYKTLPDYDVFDIKARSKGVLHKPEIRWGKLVDLNILPMESPYEYDDDEYVPLTGPLKSVLQKGPSKGDYEDIVLQICDILIELENQDTPKYVKKIPLEQLEIVGRNELIAKELEYDGTEKEHSISALLLFINETAGEHKKHYDAILKNSIRYDTLEDIKKAVEKVSMTFLARYAAIFLLLVMVFFVSRRILRRLITPLWKAILRALSWS